MRRYCFDTNFLIEAKNGPYSFKVFPIFWDWLDTQLKEGILFSSILVYDELSKGNDDLSGWVKNRKNEGFFIIPNETVQSIFKNIANYINRNSSNYRPGEIQSFLGGADPWIIALAKAENAIVVTNETLVSSNSKAIKIPNICRQLRIECIHPYKMLDELVQFK